MLEITVSPEVEQQLNDLATQNNESVKSLASKLLAEKVAETVKQNGNGNHQETNDEPRKFLRMKGMFSSGKTDTSERAKEILRADIRRNGFGEFDDD
ncbi:MAG: hypothetical protein H7Z37_18895 [Pyrinomonadaceae bacterium]|nr:hypothetical protein [Pyrinomonadaceae bacterium]